MFVYGPNKTWASVAASLSADRPRDRISCILIRTEKTGIQWKENQLPVIPAGVDMDTMALRVLRRAAHVSGFPHRMRDGA